MRYAVAHGRRSGRGGAAALGREAVARLRAAGHEVVELEASDLDEARRLAANAVATGVDVLAVAGGDGIVSLAANLVVGTTTAVGILPAGSGNDIARSLGVPLDPAGALDTLVAGRRRTIDTLELPQLGRHVLASVNAGLDARIAHRATTLPRRLGAASYTVSALVEIARLPRTEPLRFVLRTVDSVGHVATETLDALVVVPANLGWVGGGLHVAPDTDPDDGLLDLVVVRPVSPPEAVRLLRAVRSGRHTSLPSVSVRRVREVRIQGPNDVLAHGDGEPLSRLPLTVRVSRASLQVVT